MAKGTGSNFELLPPQLLLAAGIVFPLYWRSSPSLDELLEMPKTSCKQQEKHRNREPDLVSHYRQVRVRAVAGALEHQGRRNNTVRSGKRVAPYTPNKSQSK